MTKASLIRHRCPECGEVLYVGYGEAECAKCHKVYHLIDIAILWQEKARELEARVLNVVNYIRESETGEKWCRVADLLETVEVEES